LVGCILRKNWLLNHTFDGKTEGGIGVKRRWERRCKQLRHDSQEARGYGKLKENALDHTLWRVRFGRGCGPVIRHCCTKEWRNECCFYTVYNHDKAFWETNFFQNKHRLPSVFCPIFACRRLSRSKHIASYCKKRRHFICKKTRRVWLSHVINKTWSDKGISSLKNEHEIHLYLRISV
jgi:hypothetical protein